MPSLEDLLSRSSTVVNNARHSATTATELEERMQRVSSKFNDLRASANRDSRASRMLHAMQNAANVRASRDDLHESAKDAEEEGEEDGGTAKTPSPVAARQSARAEQREREHVEQIRRQLAVHMANGELGKAGDLSRELLRLEGSGSPTPRSKGNTPRPEVAASEDSPSPPARPSKKFLSYLPSKRTSAPPRHNAAKGSQRRISGSRSLFGRRRSARVSQSENPEAGEDEQVKHLREVASTEPGITGFRAFGIKYTSGFMRSSRRMSRRASRPVPFPSTV
eukprot:1679210-Prymnesium_polylepis.1